MEFTVAIEFLGLVMLALVSLVIGIIFYAFGDPQFEFEWLVSATAAFVGGFVASEFVIAFTAWEPVFDGLALIPALVGVFVVGGLAAGVTRFLTGEPLATTGTR